LQSADEVAFADPVLADNQDDVPGLDVEIEKLAKFVILIRESCSAPSRRMFF